tara:strand:- start:119 stop:349 length:231 start_codon:yes stop_codon:yes gene_type:complete
LESVGVKILDLHNVERCDILFVVEKFMTDNFDNLPVKIITGHSRYNINEVNNLATKHELKTHKERWVNSGAWVITN